MNSQFEVLKQALIWLGPQEGVETLGVYYSPNYQGAASTPRALWETP